MTLAGEDREEREAPPHADPEGPSAPPPSPLPEDDPSTPEEPDPEE